MSTSIKNHLSEYQVINNITETINYGSNCWKRYTTEERTDESGTTYKEPSTFDKYIVDDNSEAYPYEGFDSKEEYYYKNILVPDEKYSDYGLIQIDNTGSESNFILISHSLEKEPSLVRIARVGDIDEGTTSFKYYIPTGVGTRYFYTKEEVSNSQTGEGTVTEGTTEEVTGTVTYNYTFNSEEIPANAEKTSGSLYVTDSIISLPGLYKGLYIWTCDMSEEE